MTTPVDICNIGMLALEQPTIQSFNDDTARANACSAVFHLAMGAVLQSHWWDDATEWIDLAHSGSAMTNRGQWQYRFQMPADMLTVQTVRAANADATAPYAAPMTQWKRIGQFIYSTGIGPIAVRYTRNLALDAQTYQNIPGGAGLRIKPMLAQCVGYRVASMVAKKINGSDTDAQVMFDLYQRTMAEAMANDSEQDGSEYGHARVISDDAWTYPTG